MFVNLKLRVTICEVILYIIEKLSLRLMKFLYFILLLPLVVNAQDQRIDENYSQLKFIENKGQWDKNILFKTDVPNGVAFFSEDAIAYTFYEMPTTTSNQPHGHEPNQNVAYHNLIIDFKYSQKSPIVGEQAWAGEWNYLLGNDPSKWASHVTGYKKISYQKTYLHIYTNSFIVNHIFK